jgi:NAD(P)-dependent dehydrogenase (short-subunit alcohol dehydrogenase family)
VRHLEEKAVILAGASSSIGRAIAHLFAQHGARLLLSDVGGNPDGAGLDPRGAEPLAAELRAGGAEALAHASQASTPDGARLLVDRALGAFGRVDVLVNCATVMATESLLELEPESWHAAREVLLDTSLFVCQAAARVMQKQGHGRIVNTTGFEGLVGGFGKVSAALGTAGIYGLTRAASVELQRHGITVNAVAPLTRNREADRQETESFTPEHVAPVVLFLASELCGARTGLVVGAAGSRVSVFRVLESSGRAKESREPWSPQEILDHWESIAKFRI